MELRKPELQPSLVVAKAIARMQEDLHLSGSDTAKMIGVSPATFSRIKNVGLDPEKKSGELALLLIRVYRSLFALFGGNTSQMQHWLQTSNNALHGVPVQLLQSVVGMTSVLQYLDAMRGNA